MESSTTQFFQASAPKSASKVSKWRKPALFITCVCAVSMVVATIVVLLDTNGTSSSSSSGSSSDSVGYQSTGPSKGFFFFRNDGDETIACWKSSYGRGVGTIPTSCGDEQYDAGLCYPYCKEGYYGVGPVCWQYCPEGWIDEGALCRKDGSIETIAKDSYGRGVGTIPNDCGEGNEYDAGLCYPECDRFYDGVGPVCWQHCPLIDPVDGGAICCRNATVCQDTIVDLTTELPLAIAQIVISAGSPVAMIKAVVDLINAIFGFVLPSCDKL
jgi:hypothetical protein